MKLTMNNIHFVKEYTQDGMTYAWFVVMKSNRVSDTRSYINYDENGRTTAKEYPKEWLPKTVQKFIDQSNREEFTPEHETKYVSIAHWIYR
jgi:hypothetical protein